MACFKRLRAGLSYCFDFASFAVFVVSFDQPRQARRNRREFLRWVKRWGALHGPRMRVNFLSFWNVSLGLLRLGFPNHQDWVDKSTDTSVTLMMKVPHARKVRSHKMVSSSFKFVKWCRVDIFPQHIDCLENRIFIHQAEDIKPQVGSLPSGIPSMLKLTHAITSRLPVFFAAH